MKNLYFIALCFFLVAPTSAQVHFQPFQSYSVPADAEVVAIGDVNNDGLNDVVLGTNKIFGVPADYKVMVYLQDNFGQLGLPAVYSYPKSTPGIYSIAIDDINNDQRNDVIISHSDSLGIYYQNSNGTLDSLINYYSGTRLDAIATGDLNNDGLADIAACHWNAQFIKIFYQNSSGFIIDTVGKLQTGSNEIEIADINNDGLDDIIHMAGQGTFGIYVYTQDSSGSLNNWVKYKPPVITAYGIDVGDLNNDGLNDLAGTYSANIPNAKLYLYFQNNVTNLLDSPASTILTYDSPEPVEIADLNCDGKNEIVVVYSNQRFVVFGQDSAGIYQEYLTDTAGLGVNFNPYGLAIGDVNNDGKLDLAVADSHDDLLIFINNSTPTQFNHIDTLLQSDTLYTDTYDFYNIYVSYTPVVIGGSNYTQIDSFNLHTTYQRDSIKIDSTFHRFANFCGQPFADTLIYTDTSEYISVFSIDSTLISTTIDSTIGIEETNYNNIRLYPNPSGDYLYIEIKDWLIPELTAIRIYNSIGEQCYETKIHSRQPYSVDIKSLSNGFYFLVLDAKGIVHRKSFLKNKN